MEEEKVVDATEELVRPVEECCAEHNCEQEEIHVRTATELMEVPYEKMTEDERKYFISALKMKCSELDGMVQKAFERSNKIAEARNKDLRLMEDTLTFIKTTVGNSLGSVTLAIKNMEREVTNNGN